VLAVITTTEVSTVRADPEGYRRGVVIVEEDLDRRRCQHDQIAVIGPLAELRGEYFDGCPVALNVTLS
jgi:hypothetical protein